MTIYCYISHVQVINNFSDKDFHRSIWKREDAVPAGHLHASSSIHCGDRAGKRWGDSMAFNFRRGYAYPRNMSVWVGYTDAKTGIRHQHAIRPAIKLDAPVRKRNGKYQWPIDVRQKIAEFFERLEHGEVEGGGVSPLLSEALEMYLARYRKKGRTAVAHRNAANQFVTHMGDMRVAGITEEVISAWTEKLEKSGFKKTIRVKVPFTGEKPKSSRRRFEYRTEDVNQPYRQNSINNFHRSLHPIFRLAVAKGWMEKDPFADRKIMEKPAALSIVIFTNAQVQEILRRAAEIRRKDRFHPEFDDAFRFMLMTGFRVGEVVDLLWDHVSFEHEHIRVMSKDEGRWDYFPMPKGSKLYSIMQGLTREHKPKVFRWSDTHILTVVMTRILRDMGLKTGKGERDDSGYKLHTLRKTFISNLVLSGISPERTKRMARHRSYATTEKYYIAFGKEALLTGVQAFDSSELAAILTDNFPEVQDDDSEQERKSA